MRLSKIGVTGLFHKYNHSIPLNLDDRITIIHGLNGYGKTTLLELLNGILNESYEILEEVPFHILQLDFDDNSKIKIYRNYFFLACQSLNDNNYDRFVKNEYYQPEAIIFEYIPNMSDKKSYFSYDGSEFKDMKFEKDYKNDDIKLLKIKENIKFDLDSRDYFMKILDFQNKSFNKNFDPIKKQEAKLAEVQKKMQEMKNEEDVIKKKINELEIQIHEIEKYESEKEDQNQNLKENKKLLERKLAQVLMELKDLEKENSLFETFDPISQSNLDAAKISERLKKTKLQTEKIKKRVEEYKTEIIDIENYQLKQNNQRQYELKEKRNLLLNNIMQLKTNYAQIQSLRNKLAHQREGEEKPKKIPQKIPKFLHDLKKAIPVYFIESQRLSSQVNPKKPEKISMSINLCSQEIRDRDRDSQTLKKTQLFVEIIESYLDKKTVKVTNKEGLIFVDAITGTKIFPEQLSSGEQHLIIIFFNLLFNTLRNSLVLIDEPELSLHIHWQRKFLKTVLKIADLNEIDCILATHAPQLIHDRRDLTISLKGADNV
jgi:energy-coupling factor transporter ATP-binding protein EcfA2